MSKTNEEIPKKKKEVSENVQRINELFQKYSITNDEKKVFLKLRSACKKAKYSLNYEEIICCLIAKKTYVKTLPLLKKYDSVIKEFKFGRTELEKKHLEYIKRGFFWTDPRIKGKNGECVMFVKVSEFGMKTSEIIENEEVLTEANLLFFHRFFIGNVDAIRNGIIMVNDLRGLSAKMMFNKQIWAMKRRTSPIMTKIPMRLKSYIMMHPPWYISWVLAICKKIMSKKLMKRIVLANGSDKEVVNIAMKYVSGLPIEMGGTFKFDVLEGLRRVLVQSKEDEELFNSIIDSKKPKKKDVEEIEGEKI